MDIFSEPFALAKKKMCELRTNEATQEFYQTFVNLVKCGTWINAPINERKIVIKKIRGGHYIAIYSSLRNRVTGDSKDVITTDINKFIDALYENPRLLGIVVDPSKDPFIINRKAIHFLTDRKDPRLVQKDWGKGIPNYTENDLMVPEELLDFGMQVVEDYFLKDSGFTILETNYGIETFPNFALQKNGQIFLLAVEVAVGERPICSLRNKDFYLASCKRFNARCLYAPIGLVPIDKERAANKLALYGDGYNIIFSGVEELN